MKLTRVAYYITTQQPFDSNSFYRCLSRDEVQLFMKVLDSIVELSKDPINEIEPELAEEIILMLKQTKNEEDYSNSIYFTNGGSPPFYHINEAVSLYSREGEWRFGTDLRTDNSPSYYGGSYSCDAKEFVDGLIDFLRESFLNK